MPLIKLESLDDPRLAPFRNLRTNTMERKAALFIAEGMLLVRRLLESPFQVHSLLVDERRLDEIGLSIPPDVPVYLVPTGFTEQVIGFNFHRGIVACGRRPATLDVKKLPRLDKRQWIIVAVAEVQDPENVGSILRNAAAFGAHAVIFGARSGDSFSRRVLRVSMGAPFQLPIAECNDLIEAVQWLRTEYGATIATTVLDNTAQALETVTRPDRLVLVFGSEGHGLSDRWNSVADRRLTIPMSALADSLNVSVSSAVFLHYFTRVATAEAK